MPPHPLFLSSLVPLVDGAGAAAAAAFEARAYHVTGQGDKLGRIAGITAARGDALARFSTSLFTGDVRERVAAL